LVFFRKSALPKPVESMIKINGHRLCFSKSMKYLGILVDEHLSGNEHCLSLVPTPRRAVGIIKKTRHFLAHKDLLSIYYGVFSSILTYGCQIWCSSTLTKSIQKLQNDAIRAITNLKSFEHVSPSYYKLKILKLHDQVCLMDLLFIHDYFS